MVIASRNRSRVAFGPEMPGVGSWDWVGAELSAALRDEFEVLTFQGEIPDCDAVVIVKYKPLLTEVLRAGCNTSVLFCPIDGYGSAADIDADYELLRRCQRVILHAACLAKYFQSYARVETLDHHILYAAPLRNDQPGDGPILWTGLRSNLPPLVDWVNSHGLPGELKILTNLAVGESPNPAAFGFRDSIPVCIKPWSAGRHRAALAEARGAIDIKGDDFRQRHKPPAKAVDCIASGVPLAMNADSSSAAWLRQIGFQVADPTDRKRWFSDEYLQETRHLGGEFRNRLSRELVAGKLSRVIHDAIEERARCRA